MDPDEVKVPKEPYYWVDTADNTAGRVEGTFDRLENPGGLSSFYHRPVFASVTRGGQYKANFLPAFYQPIPPNEDQIQFIHMEGGFFLPGVEEGGRMVWCEGENF